MSRLFDENLRKIHKMFLKKLAYEYLAHLSRRLIGELLVYRVIHRPSVVNISNDFFSEAAGPILLIFHI